MTQRRAGHMAALLAALAGGVRIVSHDPGAGKPMTPEMRRERDTARKARAPLCVPKAEAKRERRRKRNLGVAE